MKLNKMCFCSSQMKMDKGNMYGKHHGQLVPVLLVVLSWPTEMMQAYCFPQGLHQYR